MVLLVPRLEKPLRGASCKCSLASGSRWKSLKDGEGGVGGVRGMGLLQFCLHMVQILKGAFTGVRISMST